MTLLTDTQREATTLMLKRAEYAFSGNLMPFWLEHSWDAQYGGFLTRLDRQGRLLDDSEKVLMMQVRMLFILAAAHRSCMFGGDCLTLAARTYDYITHKFWDVRDGGFYFSVARDGTPRCLRKNTDFHGYALTGLSEYASASGDFSALAWTNRVFEVLQEKAADPPFGFLEDFDGKDWPALNAEQMQLGNQTRIKTIDMHTNMLEGLTYLCRVSGSDHHKSALHQLLDLICSRGVYPEYGCTVTAFTPDWQAVGDAAGRRTTSYGLNVELAWLIWEAAAVLALLDGQYGRIALGLLDHALNFGFDAERGGLAAYGPLSGKVIEADSLGEARLNKSWWAQAELLNALCTAFERTGEERYFDALQKTFDWIYRFQIDHEYGDWYQDTHWETGAPLTTNKGNEFKTAFHAGRALIRLATALRKWK